MQLLWFGRNRIPNFEIQKNGLFLKFETTDCKCRFLFLKYMKKNKIIFLVLAVLFAVTMIWIGLDMSSKTTFPGSKGNLKERIAPSDSLNKQ